MRGSIAAMNPITSNYTDRMHAVAIFDLLGQKDALRAWAEHADGATVDYDALRSEIDSSAGRVMDLRLQIRDMIEGWKPDLAKWDRYPQAKRDKARSLLKLDLRMQVFGDTVVLYAPAHLSDEHPTLMELYSIIHGAGSIMLSYLARGIPVRGAIEIGRGIELGNGDLYGPVLAYAHQLESEVAKQPRVVVGPRAVGLLEEVARLDGPSIDESFGSKMARVCLDVIRNGSNAKEVDFLGKRFADWCKHRSLNPFEPGLKFVFSQIERFSSCSDSRQKKVCDELVRRYNVVRDYYFAMRPLWKWSVTTSGGEPAAAADAGRTE